MKRLIKRVVYFFVLRFVNKEAAGKAIVTLGAIYNIDLINLAHHASGIMKYENALVSGEEYLQRKVLIPYFRQNGIDRPVLFDIGANKGNYSIALSRTFPAAHICSFEPNPRTFELLQKNTAACSGIKAFPFGFGAEVKTSLIYTYQSEPDSEHASLYKNVLADMHHALEISDMEISIDTLDHFCTENDIPKINFLKVDTEGFELEVLKGAALMISSKSIDFIQFEFNEMNIISRVFLKDFYETLAGYSFYRLDTNRLIPLGGYNPANEIFRFHNILAVRSGVNIS